MSTRGSTQLEDEGEGELPEWLREDWVVPGTVDEVNELWEGWRLAGWRRGHEPEGWSRDGERLRGGAGGARGGDEVGERTGTRIGSEAGTCTGSESGLGPGLGQGAELGLGPGTGQGVSSEARRRRRASSRKRKTREEDVPASAQSEVGKRGGSRCRRDSGSAERRRRCGDECSDAGAHAGVARGVRGKSDDESIAEHGYMGQRVRVEGGQRRGLKRRGAVVDGEEGWLTCVVGECRVGDGLVVAGRRVIRLADVVAGRRRTRKQRVAEMPPFCEAATGPHVYRSGNRVLQAGETTFGGESSRQATSGWSGDEEGRWQVIRQYEESRVVATESRRGYTAGAAWDEGNMIQAMARLKNPTIAWRFGDG